MVEVAVSRLGLDSSTNTYVVILQEKGGSRVLPIWIGHPEAESIALHLNSAKRERPLTHDLCKSLVLGLGGTLQRVQITKVHHGTYYAELQLKGPGGPVRVDARPSDSIAIAIRLGAPIFAPEALLSSAAEREEDDDSQGYASPPAAPRAARDSDALTAEQLKAHLENLRPEDFGKFGV
jgi:bifunctional DNase/RNase